MLRAGLWSVNALLRFLADRSREEQLPFSASDFGSVRQFFLTLDQPDPRAKEYVKTHANRLALTVLLTPKSKTSGRCLELGSYMHVAPALKCFSGYRQISAAGFGPKGVKVPKIATCGGREILSCETDLFDAEKDEFPYSSGSFEAVLACELLEHLRADPMHMLFEIYRVLEPEGALVITTPNSASISSLEQILWRSSNPYTYSLYPNPEGPEGDHGASHIREYTPDELTRLVQCGGFRVESLITRPGRSVETKDLIEDLLLHYGFPMELRGEQTYCLARKVPAADRTRFPSFLYG